MVASLPFDLCDSCGTDTFLHRCILSMENNHPNPDLSQVVENAVNHQVAAHVNQMFSEYLGQRISDRRATNGVFDPTYNMTVRNDMQAGMDCILQTRKLILEVFNDKMKESFNPVDID